jgi:hypothetical protein
MKQLPNTPATAAQPLGVPQAQVLPQPAITATPSGRLCPGAVMPNGQWQCHTPRLVRYTCPYNPLF